jgi:hypothetical protein
MHHDALAGKGVSKKPSGASTFSDHSKSRFAAAQKLALRAQTICAADAALRYKSGYRKMTKCAFRIPCWRLEGVGGGKGIVKFPAN